MNIFEQASKRSLRFNTAVGILSTEDLWNLVLTDLDTLAVSLKKTVDDTSVLSFINTTKKTNTDLILRFEIAKRIIEVRLAAQVKAANAKARKEERAKIMEIIDGKQDDALRKKSITSLKAMLAEDKDEEYE